MSKKILAIVMSATMLFIAGATPKSVLGATNTITPVIQWRQCFSDSTVSTMYGNYTEQTTDGGFITCGSFGKNMYILKTDSTGNKLWEQKLYQLSSSAKIIRQTSDGGYIVAGDSDHTGHLLKLDSIGNIVWDKTLSNSQSLNSVDITSDGSYVVTGDSINTPTYNYDIYFAKIDSNGNIITETKFGGTNFDAGISVKQTPDGGYAILGNTNSYLLKPNSMGLYLIKLDKNLGTQWSTYSLGNNLSSRNYSFNGLDLICTSDGGYAIAGYEDYKAFLMKVTSAGTMSWEKVYQRGSISSVAQAIDGSFMVTGDKTTPSYDSYPFISNISSTGVVNNEINSETGSYCIGRRICPTNDGGYIVTNSLNQNGKIELLKIK